MNTTMSMRMPEELAGEIEHIAAQTGKTKSSVIIEAVKEYVARESWQIQEIKDALEEAERGEFATKAEMNEFWARWL